MTKLKKWSTRGKWRDDGTYCEQLIGEGIMSLDLDSLHPDYFKAIVDMHNDAVSEAYKFGLVEGAKIREDVYNETE